MDAKTLFRLLRPHLDSMEPQEKKSLSKLIVGIRGKSLSGGRRKILSVAKAKEKLQLFRTMEMERERGEIS